MSLLCSKLLIKNLKTLRILVLFLFCQPAFCQDGFLPVDDKKNVGYSDVGRLKNTKEEIYDKAQKWAAKTLGNYENLATPEDTKSGKLVINSYTPLSHSLYDYVRFNLTIECDSNRYQARIDQLDGTSAVRTPVRFSTKENDAVTEKAMILKTETNRKKRVEAERNLKNVRADNEGINNAVYRLLAGLKAYMTAESER